MKLLQAVFILLASVAASVNAQKSPAARALSSCGLIKNKIYCFGGDIGTRTEEIFDTVMVSLDISKAKGISMSEFGNSWAIESPNTAGISIPKRRNNQYGAVGSQLVISGGSNIPETDPALVYQTIAYNADDNTWRSYPNYVEGNFGNRQIYYASTTVVPSKGLAFYGGYERPYNPNWTMDTDQNLTETVRSDNNYRAIGYVSVVYLDITNVNNPWNTPPQTNVPTTFSSFQISAYDPTSSKIFYFGGSYEDISNPYYNFNHLKTSHRLSYTLTFDTSNGAWGNQTLTGVIPTDRKFFTTTFLPNGQPTILLYGGEMHTTVSMDFCFTLDLKSFAWTQLNINAPGVDLRRSKHNDALVNNETLFIVMGFNGVETITTIPIVLNVSNPSNITYIEKYTHPSALVDPLVDPLADPRVDPRVNSTDKSLDGAAQKEGISGGAIAGIAVGAAAGGIIACVAIFFCWRKKKAQRENRSQDVIEVNWDEIDRQYTEIPARNHEGDISTVIGNNTSSKGSIAPHSSPIIPDIANPITPDIANPTIPDIAKPIIPDIAESKRPNASDQIP